MPRVTRRGLLLGASAAGLLATTPPATPRARNLLIVVAWGGWDTTVSLDPKPDAPAPLPAGQVGRVGDIDFWAADRWPAVTACLERWWPITHVVRGIEVRSVAHVVAIRRLLTGTPDPAAPDVGAIVAATRGFDRPLPYLTLGIRAMPGELASVAASAGLNNQIAALVDEGVLDPTEEAIVAASVARADQRWTSAGLGAPALGKLQDLAASRERAAALLGRPMGEPGSTIGFDKQVDIALHALSEGLSRSVMVDAGLNFDTHTENVRQLALTDTLFTQVDDLLSRLAETPSPDRAGHVLLDDTLVLLVSEMTRTPRLNAGGGKDHWPWATTALFGAGVRHGLSGSTDADQVGQTIDLLTGGPGPTAPRGEHLVAGVLDHLGVDPVPWTSAEPILSFSA